MAGTMHEAPQSGLGAKHVPGIGSSGSRARAHVEAARRAWDRFAENPDASDRDVLIWLEAERRLCEALAM